MKSNRKGDWQTIEATKRRGDGVVLSSKQRIQLRFASFRKSIKRLPHSIYKRLFLFRQFSSTKGISRKPTLWLSTGVVLIAGFIFLTAEPPKGVLGATAVETLYVNGDYSTTGWGDGTTGYTSGVSDGSCSAGTLCNYVDEADDSEYIGTGTDGSDGDLVEFEFPSLAHEASIIEVTKVELTVRTQIISQAGGTDDDMYAFLYIDGAGEPSFPIITPTSTLGNQSVNWSGLSKSQAADLRIQVQRNQKGSGDADDDVRLFEVRVDVTYTYTSPPPKLAMSGYAFLNDDGTAAGVASYLVDTTDNTQLSSAASNKRNWFDGTRHWTTFVANGDIEFWYSSDNGASWQQNTSATINETNQIKQYVIVADDPTTLYISYTDQTLDEIFVREATSYPSPSFSWNSSELATTVGANTSINIQDAILLADNKLMLGFSSNTLTDPGCGFLCSFPSGTKIALENGQTKNIEDIVVGDSVLGFNQDSGELAVQLVTRLFQHEDTLLRISTRSTSVDVTSNHPFFMGNRQFKEAGNLDIGEKLFLLRPNSSIQAETITDIKELNNSKVVYNFSTAADSTYIANNFLVHNIGDTYEIKSIKATNAGSISIWDSSQQLYTTSNLQYAIRQFRLAPIDTNRAVAVYSYNASTQNLVTKTHDGSTWGSATTLENNLFTEESINDVNLNSNGSAVFLVWNGQDNSPALNNLWFRQYNGSSWNSKLQLYTDSEISDTVKYNSLSFDSTNDYIYLNWLDPISDSIYKLVGTSPYGNGDWGTVPSELYTTDSDDISYLYSSYEVDANGYTILQWRAKNSNPYDINAYIQPVGALGDPSSVLATSSFASGKSLDYVRQGEKIKLHTQLTNQGGALEADDKLALFYDHGDGIWSKVSAPGAPETTAGSGCGAGADPNYVCEKIATSVGTLAGVTGTDMVVGPDGKIYSVFRDTELNFGAKYRLYFATYVGNGLGNCDTVAGSNGSNDWQCELVYGGGDNDGGSNPQLSIDEAGVPRIVWNDDNGAIKIATYVGTGGNNCDSGGTGSDFWDCTTVWNGGIGLDIDYNRTTMIVDGDNNPWSTWSTSYNGDGQLWAAQYVGSAGQDCDDLAPSGGSDVWDCTLIYDGQFTNSATRQSAAINEYGHPLVSFQDQGDVFLAEFVGTNNGNCNGIGQSGGSADWQCTLIWESDDSSDGGSVNGLAVAPDGNPWLSFYDDETNDRLLVASYVGTPGQNCDEVGGANGSDEWHCEVVFDSSATTGDYSQLSFSPGGEAWVVFSSAVTNDGKVYSARRVGGSNGNCDTLGSLGGSSDWQCTEIYDGSTTSDGQQLNMAFDTNGNPWFSYVVGDNDFYISRATRRSEITITPSTIVDSTDFTDRSYSDMTSISDTTNQDDADCIDGSANWNNGSIIESETGINLSLPDGRTTKQCTEVEWIIDTSQAEPGQTYRFAVAAADSYNDAKTPWRGPTSVTNALYPQITISPAQQSVYRYSKTNTFVGNGLDCTNSEWICQSVDSTNNVGQYASMRTNHLGVPGISYLYADTNDLRYAEFVGTGGSGCASTAWNCTVVETTNDVGAYSALAYDQNNNPWIAYYDTSNTDMRIARYTGSGSESSCGGGSSDWYCETIYSGTSGQFASIASDVAGSMWVVFYDAGLNRVVVARFVGNGHGNGCSSADWSCYSLTSNVSFTGQYTGPDSIAFDESGNPWITYYNSNSDDLFVARFVGTGGSGCRTSSFTCTAIETSDDVGRQASIAFDANNTPWISYHKLTNSDLVVAKYVGSGGTGCASATWTCTDVDTAEANGAYSSLAIAPDGKPWVAYHESGTLDLKIARYVGSGGSGCAISSWSCSDVQTTGNAGINAQLVFDGDGVPFISYYDSDVANQNLVVAKMKLPPTNPSITAKAPYNGRNAVSTALGTVLHSGVSPYTNSYETCNADVNSYGYCGLYGIDEKLDAVTAQIGERPMYLFSTRYLSNTELPNVEVQLRSSIAPSSKNIVLQVYRYGTTNAWETVSTLSSGTCSTSNCTIKAIPGGTTSEYFASNGAGEYWVHYRIYQVESAFSSIELKVDGYKTSQPQLQLRGGRVFREQNSQSLGW